LIKLFGWEKKMNLKVADQWSFYHVIPNCP